MNYLNNQLIPEFEKLIDPEVKKLINFLREKGVGCLLVGGAVRDWILTGKLSNDLDFEIYPLKECDETSWLNNLKDVFKNGYEQNDFYVHKIKINDNDLEFAPARRESYQEGQSSFSHSDFKADFILSFDPKHSFLRRDFTCNAMGISFDQNAFVFIDPFNGFVDLKNKILKPCSENFFCDPVRFLRAIRFSIKLDFSFSRELSEQIENINIEKLSDYYFFKEAFKSGDFFAFINNCFNIIKEKSISLPTFFEELKYLNRKESFFPATKMEVFLGLCVLDNPVEELINLNTLFQFKKGLVSKWYQLMTMLKKIELIKLKLNITFEEFKNYSDKEDLLSLFTIVKKLNMSEKEISFIETMDMEMFQKLEYISSQSSRELLKPKTDLATLVIEERKLFQAYSFFSIS